MLHLDTSFLIDLERETSRDKPGPAFEFLEALDPVEVLAVSVHALCELRTGAELTRKAALPPPTHASWRPSIARSGTWRRWTC